MKWLKTKKKVFREIEVVNDELNKHCINLSPKDYTPIDPEDDNDMVYLSVIVNKNPSTFELKQLLLDLQKQYDKSDEINSFTINGIVGWFDNATRLALINSCNILIENGIDEYTLWIGNENIVVNPVDLKVFLKELELYAMNCYKKTAEHINTINSLSSRNDIFNFDISNGYPEKINYDTQRGTLYS